MVCVVCLSPVIGMILSFWLRQHPSQMCLYESSAKVNSTRSTINWHLNHRVLHARVISSWSHTNQKCVAIKRNIRKKMSPHLSIGPGTLSALMTRPSPRARCRTSCNVLETRQQHNRRLFSTQNDSATASLRLPPSPQRKCTTDWFSFDCGSWNEKGAPFIAA